MQTTHFAIWLGDAVNDAVHQGDDVMLKAAWRLGKGAAGKPEEEKMRTQCVGLRDATATT